MAANGYLRFQQAREEYIKLNESTSRTRKRLYGPLVLKCHCSQEKFISSVGSKFSN